MSENKLKKPAPKPPAEEKKKAPRRQIRPAKGFVRFMNAFGIFDRNQIVNAMPFILFLSVMIIGYIANSYYAERMIREIDQTKNSLKESRAEYISTTSRLMYYSKQSEIARALQYTGISETTEPPQKIYIPLREE